LSNRESLEQRAFFQWARLHPVARRFFAIPNGGKRGKVTAAILKAEGVKAGVLDTFLPVPAHNFHGLWIEFKWGDNNLTNEQRAFAKDALANGYAVAVAYNSEAAIGLTIDYLRGCPRLQDGLIVVR